MGDRRFLFSQVISRIVLSAQMVMLHGSLQNDTGRRGGGVWRDDDATDGQHALIYALYSCSLFQWMILPLSPLCFVMFLLSACLVLSAGLSTWYCFANSFLSCGDQQFHLLDLFAQGG